MHVAQLMPLPLTVSCFSEIQIGFTFLIPDHPGNPRQTAVKQVCVCVCVCVRVCSYAVKRVCVADKVASKITAVSFEKSVYISATEQELDGLSGDGG